MSRWRLSKSRRDFRGPLFGCVLQIQNRSALNYPRGRGRILARLYKIEMTRPLRKAEPYQFHPRVERQSLRSCRIVVESLHRCWNQEYQEIKRRWSIGRCCRENGHTERRGWGGTGTNEAVVNSKDFVCKLTRRKAKEAFPWSPRASQIVDLEYWGRNECFLKRLADLGGIEGKLVRCWIRRLCEEGSKLSRGRVEGGLVVADSYAFTTIPQFQLRLYEAARPLQSNGQREGVNQVVMEKGLQRERFRQARNQSRDNASKSLNTIARPFLSFVMFSHNP